MSGMSTEEEGNPTNVNGEESTDRKGVSSEKTGITESIEGENKGGFRHYLLMND